MNRLHVNAPEIKGVQGLGHDNSLPSDAEPGDLFEAGPRQHERTPAALRQSPYGGDVAMIAVMVRRKSARHSRTHRQAQQRLRVQYDFNVHMPPILVAKRASVSP